MRPILLVAAVLVLAEPARAEPSPCLTAFASRYLAETERSLGRTFALAEQAEVVLVFDEADALFGRRTETRDAHDRYANIEVSRLHGRLERFDTIANLEGFSRRALIAGFTGSARTAGLILIETETGVRSIRFARADRARAIAYARETMNACPPARRP
jgi:SpoVK/Ycf46/Vps4 family AAA+-type ATPase